MREVAEKLSRNGRAHGVALPGIRVTLADIINGRYERMLPTIVVGNLNAAEFVELLGERAMSRLQENGMILVFDWESRRGKVWANGGKAGQSERL